MSDAIIFGRTQSSFATPFESEPERTNGFISKNAQEAIEEALALAISNDRFLVLSQYNGNANTGRYLEFYSGISTDDAPLVFGDNPSNMISVIASTTSISSTASIGFYDLNGGTPVLLYTLTMDGLKRKIDSGTPTTPLFVIPANALLAIKIDNNSIQKPHLQLVMSSGVATI